MTTMLEIKIADWCGDGLSMYNMNINILINEYVFLKMESGEPSFTTIFPLHSHQYIYYLYMYIFNILCVYLTQNVSIIHLST
jgi:hypothetical protein